MIKFRFVNIFLGCIISISSYSQIYVPNTFTPNGDNKNDHFQVITDDTLSFYEVQIYNPSGEKIFFSNDPSQVWLGGVYYYSPNDVYSYKLSYKYPDNPVLYTKWGSILLLR